MTINTQSALRGIYPLSSNTTTNTVQLCHEIELALQGGASIIQYRDKHSDKATRLQQAQALQRLCHQYQRPLIINDDVHLAKQVGAAGVHLGKDDANYSSARATLGPDAIIGISCYNDLSTAQAAASAGADYVAFGSVFTSPTKPHAPRASIELLQEAKQVLNIPVCAIGGITLTNCHTLLRAGVDMLALISAIFAQEDIKSNTQQFVRHYAR